MFCTAEVIFFDEKSHLHPSVVFSKKEKIEMYINVKEVGDENGKGLKRVVPY